MSATALITAVAAVVAVREQLVQLDGLRLGRVGGRRRDSSGAPAVAATVLLAGVLVLVASARRSAGRPAPTPSTAMPIPTAAMTRHPRTPPPAVAVVHVVGAAVAAPGGPATGALRRPAGRRTEPAAA